MADTEETTPLEAAQAQAPATLKGWATLQFATNTLLPNALTKASTVRQATLRVLAGG